jgi:tetratricopeptide (TPR) repeat protein
MPGRCDLTALPASLLLSHLGRREHVSVMLAALSYSTARCIAGGALVRADDDDVCRYGLCQGVDGVSKDADCRYDETAMAIQRGWIAYNESRYEEAGSLFQGLLGSGTDPLEAVWGWSAVLRARGRPAEAADLIERARRDHPGELSLDRELGYVAYEQRRFGDAAEAFAALVERDPGSITDRRWQAASLRMGKQYDKAREKLEEAKRAIGDHPDLDLERGWLAYVLHEYQDAADHFRAAGANGARPDLFVPQFVTALLHLDQVDAAEKQAAAAPLTSPIAAARADIQVHKGRPKKAIKLLRKLEEELDEDGLTQLVALLHGAERDKKAQKVFDRWLRGPPQTRTLLRSLRHR